MRKTQHIHFAVCIETGEVRISIDPFLSENPSSGNGRNGCLTAKNSTPGGDR